MRPLTAEELRRAFIDFFVARDHTAVPSASVLPVDPSLLFTVAGMVPFKAYFVGDETPPYARAVSVQRCIRAGGKHNDLDDIGRTNRHFSFFEMLGNFSFGDYFKAEAIPWAWEFYTEVLGLDPERLWVTVHETDDEAALIWRDVVGVPERRIQRLGDDNFWRMADTGPCGPSSEIFWDLGPEFGADGGPAFGDSDRFIELWNLVFMQFDAQADGTMVALPRPSVDTGAGLERNLTVLAGAASVWDIDVFAPMLAAAEAITGRTYGGFPGAEADVSLRILAEHGRTMTVLASDGVVPSNEERGYVMRRIIRRAVRHAYLLGVEQLVTPAMVDATVATMGDAYPDLVRNHSSIRTIIAREEERFRATLQRGLDLLDELIAKGNITGDDAFFLHDTLGFPIDLTREIAGERRRSTDLDGFKARMAEQRTRAQDAHKAAGGKVAAPIELYRELLEVHGTTTFTGRQETITKSATVLALINGRERVARAGVGEVVDLILDMTPFYAESGGQIGDTGTITSASGAVIVVNDTQLGLPGMHVHRAVVTEGSIEEGQTVTAEIDAVRRDCIRRNHTATHILHWALRQVLGDHVAQAGSWVGPERLRFDFSHHEALTPAQLDRIEELANTEVLSDAPVRHYETTKDHATSLGAIAFFGDKYGDLVRVLEAGEHSIELCGGTHVHALGFIGPIKIVSEGSIGANLRRVEAMTGTGALARIHDDNLQLRRVSELLKVKPTEVAERVEKLLSQVKALNDDLSAVRSQQMAVAARELVATSEGPVVVVRRDGLTSDEMRALTLAARDALGSGIVAVIGLGANGDKAALAVAITADVREAGVSAAEIAAPAAKLLGGGTAKNPDFVQGGGPRIEGLDEAVRLVTEQAAHAMVAP